ncbi:MAG TPA: hypothetical protein VKB52_13700 [Rhodanobacteraceae bacterium]|nr:hypothetical protein [Rhodanobacteraceae bacterium]
MKAPLFALALVLPAAAESAAVPCAVSVTGDPLVIRMGKDEFRIAFGVTADACDTAGCAGAIRYKAAWRADDGTDGIDEKVLRYDIPSGARRSIAVDRHYFDSREGGHTTDLVEVAIEDVTCTLAPE